MFVTVIVLSKLIIKDTNKLVIIELIIILILIYILYYLKLSNSKIVASTIFVIEVKYFIFKVSGVSEEL